MYPASGGFHGAALSPAPAVRARVRFADGVIFTTGDLLAAKKLRLTEAVNSGEELAVGQCPSAELSFTVFNEAGLLDGYGYGPCEASLGARTHAAPGEPGQGPYAILRYGLDNPVVFRGSAKEPWLTVNGEAPTVQPPFPVYAVLIEGNRVYCVSKDGDLWGAAWVDGKTWDALAARTWGSLAADTWDGIQGYLAPLTSVRNWDNLAGTTWEGLANEGAVWEDFMPLLDVHPFTRAKLAKWAAQSRGAWLAGNLAYEFGETIETFEYVPLGEFTPDQPKKRRVTQVSITAHDRMVRFDVEAGPFLGALRYPTTLGALLGELCAYVGVPLATGSFINSTRLLDDAPAELEGVTCREVLGWVAEAACACARMTRDGALELAWFGAEPVTLPMERYFSLDVAEYQVKPIDKLQVLGTQSDIGVIIGNGVNGYQILDNPYLYGETDAQIRALAAPIYNRLAAFPAFSPITARAVCDWAIQAGDVIAITLKGTDYRLPVYRQTITWNGGGARVTYESAGSATRPVMSAANRRVWAQKRAVHELTVDVNGLSSRIEGVDGRVSSVEQTAGKINWVVKSGTSAANFQMTDRAISQVADSINLSGFVTFNALAGNGTTTINGANIKTGTIAAGRIDVDNLYVKHLSAADGSFTGTLSGVHGSFNNLTAAGGAVYIGMDHINVNGVQIGYLPGYGDVCVLPNSHQYGNIGVGDLAWDQCVAKRLFSSSGGVNSYSMRKLKKGIEPLALAEDAVDRLQPVRYVMRDDPEERVQIGFIADDVQAVVPELVTAFQDESMREPVLTLDYSRVAAVLALEVQRLRARVARLERSGAIA